MYKSWCFFFFFQKSLVPLFTYFKNRLNMEATFDTKVNTMPYLWFLNASHILLSTNSLSNATKWKRGPTQLWPSRTKMCSSTTKTGKWSAGWKLPPAICTRRKLSEDFATFILDRSVSVDSNCPTTKTQYICFTGSLLRRHESLDEVLRCRHYGLPSPRMDLYDGCRPSRSLGRANWS